LKDVKKMPSAGITELPQGLKKGLMDKLKKRKANIASMRHEEGADLGDKRIVDRKALAEDETIDAFTVREYETGILLQLGRFMGQVPSGLWEVQEELQVTGTEIIWVDMTDFKIRWGFGGAYTKDKKKVGANGEMVLHVNNAQNFVMKIVSSKKVVERDQIEEFLLGQITTVMRVLFKDFMIDDLLGERETFQNVARAKLADTFVPWGLEMVNFEVLGFQLPEEYEQMNKDESGFERDIAKTKQQLELEKQQLEIERMKRDFARDDRVAEAEADMVANSRRTKGAKSDESTLEKELKDLESKLDELDDKLDRKEISEDTYKLRAKRYQDKIEDIKKKLG